MVLFKCILILVSILWCTVEDLSSSKGEIFIFPRLKGSFLNIVFHSFVIFAFLVLEVLLFIHAFALATDTVFTKNLLTVVAVLRQKYLSAPQ